MKKDNRFFPYLILPGLVSHIDGQDSILAVEIHRVVDHAALWEAFARILRKGAKGGDSKKRE